MPVMYQKDAPLQVVGTKTARLDLLDGVLIVNLSDKTAIQGQIGWIATSRENRLSGEPFAGALFDLALKPDTVYEVGRQGCNYSRAMALFIEMGIPEGVVTVGVIYAKFEDGTEWRYPLETLRGFEHEDIRDNPALDKLPLILWKELNQVRDAGSFPSPVPKSVQ